MTNSSYADKYDIQFFIFLTGYIKPSSVSLILSWLGASSFPVGVCPHYRSTKDTTCFSKAVQRSFHNTCVWCSHTILQLQYRYFRPGLGCKCGFCQTFGSQQSYSNLLCTTSEPNTGPINCESTYLC